MLIRRALIQDIDLLFNWTNEPEVRANSFKPSLISYDEHVRWFKEKLESKASRIFLGVDADHPVGVVRYDLLETQSKIALLSITIDKKFQGRGFGAELVRGSLEEVFSAGFCQTVDAFVKETNNTSSKLFEKSGFLQTDNNEIDKYPKSFKYRLNDIEYWTKVLGEECIAVIPARGGSKRIPLKNIKLFKGKPIIKYSIQAAKECSMFSHIIVSTDSDDIASVALQYGAEVPFKRPPAIANDFTPLVEVLIHAAENVRNQNGHYKYLCCILPTAPFITSTIIKNGFRILRLKNASAAFSVTSFPSSILRAFKINDKGYLQMIFPEYEFARSNDLPEAYHDAGQIYWLKIDPLLKGRKIFANDAVPIFISRKFVQDIDTPEDWEIAEMMYNKINLHQRKE